MIAMTKYEMVKYLRDYASLQSFIVQYQEQPIGSLFDKIMHFTGRFEDDTLEYYDRMRRVYIIYNIMKKFSYSEDFLLNRDNYISDDDLDEIILDNTYSTNMGNIDKTKLLRLIRNAFNHNDVENVDRFKISVNGRFIEIEFLYGPVKIRLSVQQLVDIYNNMMEHRKNTLNYNIDIPDDFDINSENLLEELNKLKFVHYYFNDPLSKETMEQFNQLSDARGLNSEEIRKNAEMWINLSSSINTPVKFDLTLEQKKKMESYIQAYKKLYPGLLERNQLKNNSELLLYFLKKVIPVPLLKDLDISNQITYCRFFMEDTSITLRSMISYLKQFFRENNSFNANDTHNQKTFGFLNTLSQEAIIRIGQELVYGDMMVYYPIIIYIDAVITHCCQEEIISIKGIDYKAKKIRNSLAHGRWFITADNCIMMYDADPRNIRDYDLEFVGKIDINAFVRWADIFVAQEKKKLDVIKRSYG